MRGMLSRGKSPGPNERMPHADAIAVETMSSPTPAQDAESRVRTPGRTLSAPRVTKGSQGKERVGARSAPRPAARNSKLKKAAAADREEEPGMMAFVEQRMHGDEGGVEETKGGDEVASRVRQRRMANTGSRQRDKLDPTQPYERIDRRSRPRSNSVEPKSSRGRSPAGSTKGKRDGRSLTPLQVE